MLFRILTVRSHKKVTFCDAYCYGEYRRQLLFDNQLLQGRPMTVGCVVDIEYHSGKNNRGENVFYVDDIKDIISPMNNSSYKSFQKKDESDTALEDVFAQDLNGGIHLRQWKFRVLFQERLEQILFELGVVRTYTPITTPYRGTSTASPVKAIGQYTGDRYVKITHELELKKQCYLSLAPVYEIGYVMRDRYMTVMGLNEFLTLEAVVPAQIIFDTKEFYLQVARMAMELAEELQLEYVDVFKELKVVDLLELYQREHAEFSKEEYFALYEEVIERYPHCIVLNSPQESPLGIASVYGLVLETKWVFEGHGFGHGYLDEYRHDVLKKEFLRQQEQLALKGIEAELPEDYLYACEYAAIPTLSFNLGIDRFLDCFFGRNH